MKKMFVLLFMITSSIFATYTNTGFDVGVKQGYRNDKIRVFSISNTPNFPTVPLYDTEFKNLKSYLTSVFINARYKGFCINGILNYGWILSGNGHLTLPIPFPSETFFPKAIFSKIKGNVSDLIANFGYGFDLFNSRFIIIPQVGYAQYKQNIKRKNLSPEVTISVMLGPFTAYVYDQVDGRNNKFKIKWNGPHYGGDLLFEITKKINLEAGYFYHNFTCKLSDKFIVTLSAYLSGFGKILGEINDENVSLKKKNAFGHQFNGRLSYSFFDHWKVAIFGDYFYFKVKNAKILGKERKVRLINTPPLEFFEFTAIGYAKSRSYSTAIELSYLF